MNKAERMAREIAADVERTTGRKVKSVEVTIAKTSTFTRRRKVSRGQIEADKN